MSGTVRAILFDMDNTLLRSRIDYAAMKVQVADYLEPLGLLPADGRSSRHTTSTLIGHARLTGASADVVERLWEIAAGHELAGMKEAGLEDGAAELLGTLHAEGKHTLVVLTNNAYSAAVEALRRTGVADRFDAVFGREQVPELKPSASAVQAVLRSYPDVKAAEWLSVGDSWIDGVAANGAGVPFVSYRADAAKLRSAGVQAVAAIERLEELLPLLRRTRGETSVE